jgi:hypothetical protein
VVSGASVLIGATCTAIPPQKSDVYQASNGFSYTVPNGVTIEVISAASLLASGTITLPSSPSDGMPLTLEAPNGITLVTVNANTGQTLLSGYSIAIMVARQPYRLKYSAVNSTWYPN